MREDIALDIDAGCDLDQFQACDGRTKQRALSHEQGGTSLFGCEGRIVADLLDRPDELAVPSFAHNTQPAALERRLQSARREGTAEHRLPGVLADVDKTADADDLVA